jgi:methionyl-tRNA synthetase
MPEKKVYVWFDALLGYYTASREWAVRQGGPEAWRPFWVEKALAFYVHGKDNIPFHTLILPGLLLALGDVGQRPAGIVSSEYLTLYGRKISTSRNYAIWLPDYLRRYQADALRYYFLSNGPEGRDADFSWDEFARRTNDELLGAWGNLLHRLFTLAWRHCAGQIPPVYMDDAVIQAENQAWQETFATVGALIEQAELKSAIQTAFSRIRATNRLVDQLAPWRLLDADPAAGARALATCVRYAVNAALLLLPFIPGAAQAALTNVGLTAASWRFHELPSGLSMAAEPVAPIRRITPSEADEERQLLLEQAAPER